MTAPSVSAEFAGFGKARQSVPDHFSDPLRDADRRAVGVPNAPGLDEVADDLADEERVPLGFGMDRCRQSIGAVSRSLIGRRSGRER